MEAIRLNETVKVGVCFDGNNVRPRWFVRGRRKYTIERTTYSWKSRSGETDILHFAVSDGTALYELSFNQKTLRWILEKTASAE